MENFTNNENISRRHLELKLGEQLNALISASHALNVKTAAIFDSALQPAAFLIVRWLLSHGSASATAIAEATAMDRSSVSRLINQLKNLGYIESKTSTEDRRGKIFSLTDAGCSKARNAIKEKEFVFYERISKLSNADIELYIKMLRYINDNHDE